ncbi:hypothetical protein KAT80_02800 [Candidatus Pacearchaeota archaeon]|nr:hypothetical protein [Candidatus Pacearchaeota archaeon]
MSYTGYSWECECGHIEYGENPPEECKKCGKINSFAKLPEEIVDEREKNEWEELNK